MTVATLDVNVLISALINPKGAPRQIVLEWQAGHFSHVTSDHIIATFEAKLRTPELLRRFSFLSDAGRAFLPLLRANATVVTAPPLAVTSVTGDPEDDAVLATATLGHARYLVTGDQTLLALGTYEGMDIVTPRVFVDWLDQQRGYTR